MDGTCNPVPAKRSFRHTRIFNQIAPYCLICPHRDTSIKWGQGVNIGMFSRFACINEISLTYNTFGGAVGGVIYYLGYSRKRKK